MITRVTETITGQNTISGQQSTGVGPFEPPTDPVDSHANAPNASTTAIHEPLQSEGTTASESDGNTSTTVHEIQPLQPEVMEERRRLPVKARKSNNDWKRLIKSMIMPLCASILVAFTSVLVFTSDNLNWPLARLGQTYGILVLSILSILSGLLLKAVIDQGFDNLKWGPLLARGMYLNVFLAISSGPGPKGWWSVFLWNPQTLKSFWGKWFKRSKNQAPPTVSKTVLAASAKRVQDDSRRQARIWSLMRFAFFWLVQVPSIILMSQVSPKTDFLPVKWTPVSGGIGKFDSAASAGKLKNGIVMSGLVTNMHQDTTMTFVQPPVSANCSNSPSCVSYMITGGLQAVSPWLYRRNNDSRLSVYATRNTPIYQIDFWNAPYGNGWAAKDCRIYGTTDSAFQLCMDAHDNNIIRAGWRACNGNVTPDGQCTFEGGWDAQPIWSTWVAIYRRKATVFADLRSSQTLRVTDAGIAEKQDTIRLENFTVAFNGMLHPWKNTTQVSSFVQDVELTAFLAISLYSSGVIPLISEPMDRLRNLFMAPIYAYNTVSSGIGNNFEVAVTTAQTGLPAENYIDGSLARPISYLSISTWTKLVYAALSGLLILLAGTVTLVSWLEAPSQETSDFQVVDFLTLTTTAPSETGQENPPVPVQGMQEVFDGFKVRDNAAILSTANGVKVYSRLRATGTI